MKFLLAAFLVASLSFYVCAQPTIPIPTPAQFQQLINLLSTNTVLLTAAGLTAAQLQALVPLYSSLSPAEFVAYVQAQPQFQTLLNNSELLQAILAFLRPSTKLDLESLVNTLTGLINNPIAQQLLNLILSGTTSGFLFDLLVSALGSIIGKRDLNALLGGFDLNNILALVLSNPQLASYINLVQSLIQNPASILALFPQVSQLLQQLGLGKRQILGGLNIQNILAQLQQYADRPEVQAIITKIRELLAQIGSGNLQEIIEKIRALIAQGQQIIAGIIGKRQSTWEIIALLSQQLDLVALQNLQQYISNPQVQAIIAKIRELLGSVQPGAINLQNILDEINRLIAQAQQIIAGIIGKRQRPTGSGF